MIHTDVINSLTEDEALLLYAVAGFIYQHMGYPVYNPEWVKMLRVDVLINTLNKIANLQDEYLSVRDSLVGKIKDAGGF